MFKPVISLEALIRFSNQHIGCEFSEEESEVQSARDLPTDSREQGLKHTPSHTKSNLPHGACQLPLLWPCPIGGQLSFYLTFSDFLFSLPY